MRTRIPLFIAVAMLFGGADAVRAQHDGHREAMLEFTSGKPERALQRLERLLEEPESLWRALGGAYARAGRTVRLKGEDYRQLVEPETHYTLALLHSHRGDGDKALEHATKALAAGLPFERFVAGPREAFEALYATEDFQELAALESVALIHGPMLGAVTEDAVSFWVRTAKESEVTVRVLGGNGAVAAGATGTTREADDFTTVIRVTGLQPDSTHLYEMLIDGAAVDLPAAEFRTHPPRGTGSAFRVVFTACAGYAPEHERVWTTIRDQDPLALLMLGDNVYIDDPRHPITHRFCYYRRFSRPEWRELVGGRGVYAIWDDHDFGDDDSFGGPEINEPAWKREAWNVFRQNWNNPAYGGGEEQPGVWFDFQIGDVHFIMLDGRYYREPNGRHDRHPPESENPSMLGPVQLAWLKRTLRESEATFRIICSPVPWALGTAPGRQALDKWEGFPAERQAIFDFLAEHQIDGVLLLSGDRHRSDLHQIKRENGYSLYDFMSAIPTNYHTHPVMQGEGFVFGYNEDNCFGVLHIDTTLEDPKLVLEVMGIDGESIKTHELRLSELSH